MIHSPPAMLCPPQATPATKTINHRPFTLQSVIHTSTLTEKGFDDQLYHFALRRDFFFKHIRLTTPGDIQKNLNDSYSKVEIDHIKQRLAETSLKSPEEVEQAKNVQLPDGWTWKEIYNALNTLRLSMLKRIGDKVGVAIPVDTNYSLFEQCQFIHFLEQDPGHYQRDIINEDDDHFAPDHVFTDEKPIHLATLDLKRQLELSHNRTHPSKAPFLPRLICIFEGICCWSDKDQKYRLIFPMSSLRLLYHECKDQVTTFLKTQDKALKKFLDEIVIIRYECKESVIASTDCVDRLQGAMNDYDLVIVDIKISAIKASNKKRIIQLTCTRNPTWKYDPDTDLGMNELKLPLPRDAGCSDDAFWNLKPYLMYKAAHDKDYDYDHARKIKHFLKYPDRPHLRIKKKLRLEVTVHICSLGKEKKGKDTPRRYLYAEFQSKYSAPSCRSATSSTNRHSVYALQKLNFTEV